MPTELYETLGVAANATPEEIRKAYKKRALETHPDRLPPGATPAEKEQSEEKFRKVNNAYEVLNDPQNRRLYDQHGVWPPPDPEYPSRPSHRHHTSSRRHTYHDDYFPDPFFGRNFAFTDPFVLFDSIFRDMHSFHSHHHGSRHRRPTFWNDHFHHDPFEDFRAHRSHGVDSFMNSMHRNTMGSFGASPFSAFPSLSASMPRQTSRWTSESTMSQTINGVTHTIHKRRDWDGNEHVTRIYPDGRQLVTINGVEQQNQGHLPPPPSRPDPRHVPPPPIMDYSNNQDRHLPPPPTGGFHTARE
ncbi:DnaJ-domain-containing protein [Dendrothele bispora CBS 962.96]|uniref:DnaJ-domain-containing protein n=1 Tax=Dendrothele bispora (strain CBS 962.96) TaxID=1314807 RepID=A0A4S8LQ23_DENBC|nr:DnaJ-domain-containing protein [Dendrothele bispora CBS 962.96]